MVELVLVNADEVRPLREALLGDGSPWPGEDEARSMHLAIKDKKRLVAAALLLHEPRADLGSEVWRLCGPLVLESDRRQGHGRRVAQALQAVAEQRGGGVWTSVPLAQLAFYSSLGFKALADDGKGADDMVLSWRPKP